MREEIIEQYSQQRQQGPPKKGKHGYFGFKGRMFPLLSGVVGLLTILWTYYVAVSKYPPDVKPFPYTDITHTAIKFPEYAIFRIGMMVSPVLMIFSVQILKNYLNMMSYEIKGEEDERVHQMGPISIFACLMLCVSTATISDGGDMNWTLHTIGATSFFIFTLYIIVVASKVYRELYLMRRFIPAWSYQLKRFTNEIILFFIAILLLSSAEVIDVGEFVEWGLAFFIMGFFLTLAADFKDMSIMLIRK